MLHYYQLAMSWPISTKWFSHRKFKIPLLGKAIKETLPPPRQKEKTKPQIISIRFLFPNPNKMLLLQMSLHKSLVFGIQIEQLN